ncbi:hypothetical protein [Marinicrinis sediminis]|uniref:Extracellular solute-binding protein n=1 Tax=Marinicrinis sediminis TaxID=1652465 RepID=A0ABW5R8H7_9BACL
MRKMWWYTACVVLLGSMWLMTGCSSENKSEQLSVFVYPKQGIPEGFADGLAQQLEQRLDLQGRELRVAGPSIYNEVKLMVEVAAGDHDLFIVSKEDLTRFMQSGDGFPLEDWFSQEDYPDGVVERVKMNEQTEMIPTGEKHLYGLPVHESKLIIEAGKEGDEPWYAFIVPQADPMDLVEETLKLLAEKGE